MAEIDKSKWPKGVRTISIDQIDALGIDDSSQLYWHGRPVVTKRSVDLTGFQTFLAVVVALSTVVGGIGSAAQGVAAYSEWACKVSWFSPGPCK